MHTCKHPWTNNQAGMFFLKDLVVFLHLSEYGTNPLDRYPKASRIWVEFSFTSLLWVFPHTRLVYFLQKPALYFWVCLPILCPFFKKNNSCSFSLTLSVKPYLFSWSTTRLNPRDLELFLLWTQSPLISARTQHVPDVNLLPYLAL